MALVMVFGMLPTSVFADGEVDTESGPASGGYGSTADGSWTGSEKAAMRMSLYLCVCWLLDIFYKTVDMNYKIDF